MTRTLRLTLAALWVLVATLGMARAENVALVISNGVYAFGADEPRLSRAHADLARLYEDRGYRVFGGENLNRASMAREMTAFSAALGRDGKAIVHFNGHVGHFAQESWLLPTDVNARTVVDVEMAAPGVGFALALLAGHDGRAVMFLGTTGAVPRDVPGLAPGLGRPPLPSGVMLISGPWAQVNQAVERDFLAFGRPVVDGIARHSRNLDIEGFIPADLVLADRRRPGVAPVPEPEVDPAELRERELALTRAERRIIQENLALLGYDTRGIDGIFGPGTRQAIREWQVDDGLRASGFLSRPQIIRLQRAADDRRAQLSAADRAYWRATGASGQRDDLLAYLQRYPNGVHASEARAALAELDVEADRRAWMRATDEDTIASYRRYLREFPEGAFARVAQARLSVLGGGTGGGADSGAGGGSAQDQRDRAQEQSLNLDAGVRMLIELRLLTLGFDPGPRDGVFDDRTRNAIRAFQFSRGLPATGYITSATLGGLLRQ